MGSLRSALAVTLLALDLLPESLLRIKIATSEIAICQVLHRTVAALEFVVCGPERVFRVNAV